MRCVTPAEQIAAFSEADLHAEVLMESNGLVLYRAVSANAAEQVGQ